MKDTLFDTFGVAVHGSSLVELPVQSNQLLAK